MGSHQIRVTKGKHAGRYMDCMGNLGPIPVPMSESEAVTLVRAARAAIAGPHWTEGPCQVLAETFKDEGKPETRTPKPAPFACEVSIGCPAKGIRSDTTVTAPSLVAALDMELNRLLGRGAWSRSYMGAAGDDERTYLAADGSTQTINGHRAAWHARVAADAIPE